VAAVATVVSVAATVVSVAATVVSVAATVVSVAEAAVVVVSESSESLLHAAATSARARTSTKTAPLLLNTERISHPFIRRNFHPLPRGTGNSRMITSLVLIVQCRRLPQGGCLGELRTPADIRHRVIHRKATHSERSCFGQRSGRRTDELCSSVLCEFDGGFGRGLDRLKGELGAVLLIDGHKNRASGWKLLEEHLLGEGVL
jgi:hypothetical protein